MTQKISAKSRLNTLPPKVAVPFRQLLEVGQLSEETLNIILDAGEVAGQTSKLLGFAIGYLHLRSKGVPVNDVIKMAKSRSRSVNLSWSAKRWKQEHDRLSHSEALLRLSEELTEYDIRFYSRSLPDTFEGYVISNSRKLAMEGFRQRHCVASYHFQIQSEQCAIAAIFVNRKRWTVQLFKTDNPETPIRIGMIRGRYNELPCLEVRNEIGKILEIPLNSSSGRTHNSYSRTQNYMSILRAVLPVLRGNNVEEVKVSFEGGGDDGAIHSIDCQPNEVSDVLSQFVEHSSQSRDFEDGEWHLSYEQVRQPLNEAIKELTYEYLTETGVDWYNNEGGFGELVINVPRSSVGLDVSIYVTESISEFSRENDILTGEEL